MAMETSSSDEIDFGNLSADAGSVIRILGSIAMESEFFFSEKEIDRIISDMKLDDEKKSIYQKLKFLGIIERGNEKNG